MNVNPPGILPLTRCAFYLRSGRLRVGLLLLLFLATLWGGSMFRGVSVNFLVGDGDGACWSFRGCVGTVVDPTGFSSAYVQRGVTFIPRGREPLRFFPAPELIWEDRIWKYRKTGIILPYWLLMAVAAAIALAFTERQFRGYRALIQNLPTASGNTGQLRA